MNNNQRQLPQFPTIVFPLNNQQQQLQIENANLKAEVQQLRTQLKDYQEIKFQKKELEIQNSNLQSRIIQRNQDPNNSRNLIEDQNLKDKYIQIQLHNLDLQKQLDFLNQKREEQKIIEIKSKPQISQNIQEETVRLSWVQKITNLQIKYQRNNKIVEFQGYGEILNKGFIFNCQCELSRIPLEGKKPQIIQKENELFLKFQI